MIIFPFSLRHELVTVHVSDACASCNTRLVSDVSGVAGGYDVSAHFVVSYADDTMQADPALHDLLAIDRPVRYLQPSFYDVPITSHG